MSSAGADEQYEQQNDAPPSGAPAGDSKDNSYVSRSGQYQIPVQKDEYPVADPIDPATADSDQMLAQDDADAIDPSNIVGSRTRGAKPTTGGYAEPGDEEGLPVDDGTSRGASSS